MRAAVVKDFSQPLQLTEMPTPTPGAGEVLIRVEASGLCHTDIHAARGDWPVKPILPFIPGHEGVGIIEAVGADVTSRRVGQRVAVPWLGSACGTCGYCLSGWESLCEGRSTPVTAATAASPSTWWPMPRSPNRSRTSSPPGTPRH